MTTYDASTVTYDASNLTYQGLPAQFDGVAFAVEMAFGYAPLDVDPSWETVTPYVRDIRIDRGRRSEYIMQSPGVLRLVLDNRDRRFDPDYTSGPYYNQLVPMVPVRVQATYSGTTWTLYRGYVQGWPSAYDTANTDAVAIVEALDGTRLLANLPLRESAYQATVLDSSPVYYWPLQDGALLTQTDIVQNRQIQFWSAVATDLPTNYRSDYPLDSPNMFDGVGLIDTDAIAWPQRHIEYWFDASKGNANIAFFKSSSNYIRIRPNVASNYVEVSYFDADNNLYLAPGGGGTNGYRFAYSGWNQFGNRLGVAIVSGACYLFANGSTFLRSLNVGTSSGATGYDPIRFEGYALSHVVAYPEAASFSDALAGMQNRYDVALSAFSGEASSARLDRVLDEVSWPSEWRQIETGDQPVGAYRPDSLAASRYLPQIDNAEQGALFVNRDGDVELRSRTTTSVANIVGLFDDNGTDLPFADVVVDGNTVDTIYNRIDGRYAYGTVTARDSSSVTAYGEALQQLDLRLIDDPADAQTIVDTRLARTKDPRTRVTRLDIPVRRDTASIVPVVAALDLYDDVAVSFTPTGVGDPLWRAVRVQGIRHTIRLDEWSVSLYLAPSPVGTNGPLLVLDDDTYGKLDSGNKLG
jgi:hypothetical protein